MTEFPAGKAIGTARSFEALVADISARLRSICSSLSDEEFSELVLDIATMKVRFTEIDAEFGRTANPVDRSSEE